MRIVLQETFDAQGNLLAAEVIHTERAGWNKVSDPYNPTGEKIDMIDFLLLMEQDSILRDKFGYNKPTKIKDKPYVASKWDAIVDAAQEDPMLIAMFSKKKGK